MKRISTILKQINELEQEMHNYTDIEIKNAIEKLEHNGYEFSGWIIDTVYQGLDIGDDEEI